jgi:hypothetical protein
MWLLDANMDVHIVKLLKELGVNSDTADSRGWKNLQNGELVGKAAVAGFNCPLTRDRHFGESAARALRAFPDFAVVVVTLPQVDSEKHHQHFLAAWHAKPYRTDCRKPHSLAAR